jgi:hypothetical protein
VAVAAAGVQETASMRRRERRPGSSSEHRWCLVGFLLVCETGRWRLGIIGMGETWPEGTRT